MKTEIIKKHLKCLKSIQQKAKILAYSIRIESYRLKDDLASIYELKYFLESVNCYLMFSKDSKVFKLVSDFTTDNGQEGTKHILKIAINCIQSQKYKNIIKDLQKRVDTLLALKQKGAIYKSTFKECNLLIEDYNS